MNLTRRNILKALGIGAAVSVSGVSIAKEPATTTWDDVQAAGKLMDSQAVPRVRGKGITYDGNSSAWINGVEYKPGDVVMASVGGKWRVVI